MNNLFWNNIFN